MTIETTEKLANEALLKYYERLAIEVAKDPNLIQLCQKELAKALHTYPLRVAEFIQKNELVNFNALEFLGVVFDDRTLPKTYKGELYIEFNDQVCYQADISKCIVRTNEIVLDFSGSDEGNRFEGSCKLEKDNMMYSGIGSFKFVTDVQSYPARIIASFKKEDDELILKGHWQDDDDHEAYELSIELYDATLE